MSNLWRRNGRDPFRDKRFRALPRHRDQNRNRDRIRILNHWFYVEQSEREKSKSRRKENLLPLPLFQHKQHHLSYSTIHNGHNNTKSRTRHAVVGEDQPRCGTRPTPKLTAFRTPFSQQTHPTPTVLHSLQMRWQLVVVGNFSNFPTLHKG